VQSKFAGKDEVKMEFEI